MSKKTAIIMALILAAGCDSKNRPGAQKQYPCFVVRDGELVRMAADRHKAWSVPLSRGWHRWRQVGNHVLVVTRSGLAKIDVETGAIVWRTDDYGGIHTTHGGLAYCARASGPGRSVDEAPHRITAVDLEAGRTLFQVDLPSLPYKLEPVGRLVMANKGYFSDRHGKWSRWIDSDGRIVFAIDEFAFACVVADTDMIALTPRSILRLRPVEGSPSGQSRAAWRVEAGTRWSLGAEAGSAAIVGDDVVVCGYHPIADSGVWLKRIAVHSGATSWSHFCEPLGVEHSQYRHRVRMRLVPQGVEVTSIGERTFVEIVDLATGSQISRAVTDSH